jgi:hypothetical protein
VLFLYSRAVISVMCHVIAEYRSWCVAFVLDGVLSDKSDTTCQIGGLFVPIDSMSFWGSAGESLGTNM